MSPTATGNEFFQSRCVPEFGSDGRVVNVLVVSRNLTEHKRAEQALRQEEEGRKVAAAVDAERRRFYEILEKLPVMVCLLAADHQVRFANRRFREFFGESEGRRCFEYVFKRSDPCPECQSFTPLDTQAPHRWEWDAPNGSYLEIYDFPFTDPDGSPLVMEVDIDITARKRAEEELARHRDHLEQEVKERTRELEASNARLQEEIAERKQAQQHLAAELDALTRMHSLSTRLLARGELEPLLQEIMDAAAEIVGAAMGTLQLLEGDSLRIVAHRGHRGPFLEFFASAEARASVCGEAMKQGQRVIVEDVESSPLFAGTPSLPILREAGVRSVQSTPLLSRDGALLGILTTQWSAPHVPDERDLWRLDVLARQAADLIEHARSQVALRRLAQFPEESPHPVLRVRDGALEYANAAGQSCLERMGASSGQLPDVLRALVEAALRESSHVEAELLASQGQIFWFLAVQPPGESYVNLYGLDVTGRKEAEERIRHHNAVLEGINRILSEALADDTEEELGRKCLAIAEQATGSKFGFIAEVNSEGLMDDLAISDPGWELCRMFDSTGVRKPPVRFKIHGIYGRVLLDQKGFFTNDPSSHPDRIGLPEGHPPLTAFLGVPLKHESKTIGMIAVGNRSGGYRQQDLQCLEALAVAVVQVLMRKRAEQAVRAAEERLRQAQKMESIGVLAGGIAHDFNNLLTSILGNASLLQMDAAPASTEQLGAIVESGERAAALTRQLLAYAGKGQFQIADFDVSRLVRSSADLIRVSSPKNIDLRVDVPRGLPMIRGDSSQIQPVVMNLVINAAEATHGREHGEVSISAASRTFDGASLRRIGADLDPGCYIVISVRDNGCGMDETTRAKIFDPFFTTKFTGRGLGLAAVHGILRSHKGAIVVESKPGEGSAFTVYLPARGAPSESGPQRTVPASAHTATVLVVDDEQPVRAFTKAALERTGCRVLLADNGRQALDQLRGQAAVDLVILDIIMPTVGGVEAFIEMRKIWPQLPVLVASGYSREEARRLGIPGDLPFIQKPYTAQALAAAVGDALKAHSHSH